MLNEQSSENQISPENQQANLTAKGYKYFGNYAGRLVRDDRSFTTMENQSMLLYFIWKLILATGGTTSESEDALDQIIDSALSEEENFNPTFEQGPQYIEAYVKSGVNDIVVFLKGVANGEYIF